MTFAEDDVVDTGVCVSLEVASGLTLRKYDVDGTANVGITLVVTL